MKQISKSALKARMLELMREIEQSGESLIVTDHGNPVLVISPYKNRVPVPELFAAEQARLVIHEDPDTPTMGEWDDV